MRLNLNKWAGNKINNTCKDLWAEGRKTTFLQLLEVLFIIEFQNNGMHNITVYFLQEILRNIKHTENAVTQFWIV